MKESVYTISKKGGRHKMYQYISDRAAGPKAQKKSSDIIQRRYPFLKDESLDKGTVLYHGTCKCYADSIRQGIEFNHGYKTQLGTGFYTTGDIKTAQKSVKGANPEIITLETLEDMNGQCADTLANNTAISPGDLKVLMSRDDAETLTADAAKNIVNDLPNEIRRAKWQGIENVEILNAGNDFIKTIEKKDPNNSKYKTWLNQYKFTENAAGKIGVKNDDYGVDSCCLIV